MERISKSVPAQVVQSRIFENVYSNVIRSTRLPKCMLLLLLSSAAFTLLFLLYTALFGIGSFTIFSTSLYYCTEAKFPHEIIGLIRACSAVAPLIIIDPDWLHCYNRGTCSSCYPTRIRFAAIHDQQNITLKRMMQNLLQVSINAGWNWDQSLQRSGVLYLTNDNSFTSIHICILKMRKNYWYLHESGDGHSRAFFGLNMTEFKGYNESEHSVYIPDLIDLYLWQWPRSRFIECNVTLAQYLMIHHPDIYKWGSYIPDSFVDILAYVRDIFTKFRITTFLAGGTALGWYRECGIIPHTFDTDLGFLTWEWKPEIEKVLKNDSSLNFRASYGKPEFGFEMVFFPQEYRMDIFGLYDRENATWIGYPHLKWIYPKLNSMTGICTGDLNEQLFFVRCDILTVLEIEYGPKWYKHHHTGKYIWDKSHFNIERNSGRK